MDAFPLPATAEGRAQLFHETYDPEIDSGLALAELVVATGKFLAKIVGQDAADRAMVEAIRPLAETVVLTEPLTPQNWPSILDEASSHCFSEWPLGARLHDLAAYAHFGIALDGDTVEEREQYLRELVEEGRRFLEIVPLRAWPMDVTVLKRVVELGCARWALDHDQPIEPSALATFGGVTEGRIRNMMAGKTALFTNEGGRIPAREALQWLAERDAFATSIWREQSPKEEVTSTLMPVAYFVPVARDGSVFSPGLQRNGTFTIGPKGSEQHLSDYNAALDVLQRMRPAPYWRRPNARGSWGIVRGVHWERMDDATLNEFAADPPKRLAPPAPWRPTVEESARGGE